MLLFTSFLGPIQALPVAVGSAKRGRDALSGKGEMSSCPRRWMC